MEPAVVLAVILGPFIVRFLLQVKDAYIEAEKERLRASGRGGGRTAGKSGCEPPREASSASRNERRYARVLGLEDGDGPDAVKRAYRRLAPQYHPDKVSHLGPKLQEVAEQAMKEINEAYGYYRRKYGLN